MMEAKNHLLGEKTKLLNQIAAAAQRGESQEVLATTEKLAKVESLIRRYEELEREVFDLDRGSPHEGPFETLEPVTGVSKTSPRLDQCAVVKTDR